MFPRCDPKSSVVAYDNESALATAIDNNQMEIWKMMRDRVELSEYEILEQLQAMIAAGREEDAHPQEEFQELLSSLSVEVVKNQKPNNAK